MSHEIDPLSNSDHQARKAFAALDPEHQSTEKMHAHDAAALLNGDSFTEQLASETDERLRDNLQQVVGISEAVQALGGRSLVVGGFARDMALRRDGHDIDPKDIDLEIYNINANDLEELLGHFGKVNLVGKQFGVIKVGDLDISIPRRDSKTGSGHKGFTIEGDPTMTVAEAAKRRDFTINALALDPLTGEIIDKFDGLQDIKNKTLRATDPESFIEDPLRVLRAMQFAGRLGFTIDQKTIELCKTLDLKEIPKERIGEEWMKLLLKSAKPSIGMQAARELDIIDQLHPELKALIGVNQNPEFHPEGDVWVHTTMAVDAAADICIRYELPEEERKIIMLAALCHDLGKPATTEVQSDGKITHYGHAEAGIEPAARLMAGINVSSKFQEKVLKIVREHMVPLTATELSDSGIKRLAKRLYPATMEELMMVSKADSTHGGTIDRNALLVRAKELKIATGKPKELLQGRDILNLGIQPGPEIGRILRSVHEAYLDGKIKSKEEALELAKSLMS